MLAAALLVSLWAQAEQAPPPVPAPATAASPAPAAAGPAPATASPLPATASPPPATASAPPATASPAPATAPAPLPAQPIVAEPAPLPAKNGLSVLVRYAYRVGTETDITAPAAGLSLGGAFERRFRAYASGIELGSAIDFFLDRFTKEVIVPTTDPANQPDGLIRDRTLSQTSFTLSPTIAWRTGDTRLFAGVGGGVTFGYFVSPDLFDGSRTAVQALVRGVLGGDFAIAKNTFAVLRVDYNHTFQHQTFTARGVTYPLFGDIFDAGAGLLLRF